MADETTASSSEIKTATDKHAERLKRLQDLKRRRESARVLNHAEVKKEEERNKLPVNHAARQRRAEWIQQDEKERQEAAENGYDYDRKKLLNTSAKEAEKMSKLKRKKNNPDTGFADFEQASKRKYDRLIKGIVPNMEGYERMKEKLGPAFYGDRNTIIHGLQEDRKEAVDKMVEDLEKQVAKREKYSRRRTHNDDADIDYINEKNAKFNQKLEHFYGEYTKETKLNLERGTAI